MKLIDISPIKLKLTKEINAYFNQKNDNKKITLATILTSNDISSQKYIKYKTKKGEELGFRVINYFEENEQKLIKLINNLNNDNNIDGILIQLPLNKKITYKKNLILNSINPIKDCDCLTSKNLAKVFENNFQLIPATVKAINEVLVYIHANNYKYSLKGKNVCIINNSNLIGLPTALIMSKKDASVTILNKYSKNIRQVIKGSDIVVTATGQGNLFDLSDFKENAIVIDVTSISIRGQVIGDVKIEKNVKNLNNNNITITPVPGGIGPLTILSLFSNLIHLKELRNNK